MLVYIVISSNFSNLPLGVYSDIDSAKKKIEQLTKAGYHGCICEYTVDKDIDNGEAVNNVYDNNL